LRKHKETKALAQEALNNNKQTRKLLTQLEHTAKDDEGFLAKVAELRKSFQQHVRDEKKELLPAVLKALSDDEAETVLANIENEKAEIEAAKRAEADERREQARQEREQVESVQRTAEGMASTVRSVADGAQIAARTAQDNVRTGFTTATEIAQRSTEQVVQLFSLTGKQTQDVAGQTAESMQAVAQSSTALARGLQEVSRAWLEMSQNRLERNVGALTAMVACRSVPELLAAQTSLIRDNLDLSVQNAERLAALSAGLVNEATQNATADRRTKPQRADRAA